LREEINKNRVCVAFEEVISLYIQSKVRMNYEQIIKSSTNVINIYGNTEFLIILMMDFQKYLMTGKVCVMSSQSDLEISRTHFMLDSFNAHLIFSYHHGRISGFTSFMQTFNPIQISKDFYLVRLGVLLFNCSLPESDCVTVENCSYNASLKWLSRHIFDMAMSEESYNL
jgi:hypothetical protein